MILQLQINMRGDWTLETHFDEIAYLCLQMRLSSQQQLKISQICQQSPVFEARAQHILNVSNFARYLRQQLHTPHPMQTAEHVRQTS